MGQERVLATFGGAGGQHACAVVDELGMTRVLVHPLAGVLSAYGLGLADVIAMRETAVEEPLSPDLVPRLDDRARSLAADGVTELPEADIAEDRIRRESRVHLRYEGTDTAVPVALASSVTALVGEPEKSGKKIELARER